MRDPLNKRIHEYINDYTGLVGENCAIVENAVYLTAVNEDLPSMERISHFEGMSQATYRKKMEIAIGEAYYDKLYKNALWPERPTVEELICSLTAGVIYSGFWTQDYAEPKDRRFVRKWLGYLCPPEAIRSKTALRGYFTLLEYIWVKILGDELGPSKSLRQRYGGNSQPSKNLKAYFQIAMEQTPAFPLFEEQKRLTLGGEVKPTALLNSLRIEISKDYAQYCNEYTEETYGMTI